MSRNIQNITGILFLLVLFSCTKGELKEAKQSKTLVLEVDGFAFLRNVNTGKKRPPRPTDTIVITPPETTPYTGKRILHIDGDGAQVNQAWGNFYCGPSEMTDAEMKAVLDSVTRAYAAQTNLLVTLNEAVYNLCPSAYRQKVVVTDSSNCFGYAGGVAYRGSFGTENYAFVFPLNLSKSVKFVSMAIAHEAGHTFGLPHKAQGYFTNGVWTVTSAYSNDWNWMGANWYYPYHIFETAAVDYYGTYWNQPLTISNTIQ